MTFVAVVIAAGVVRPSVLRAQGAPPVQGTMVIEGTMKTSYRAANTAIVLTRGGAEHVYHFTKDLLVSESMRPGLDALEDLQPGRVVVVHYFQQV